MSLLADYQARYSTQIRTNVSNPQVTSATTPNTTLETLAAADVEADFQVEAGVTYSSSNAIHVSIATSAVFARLMVLTGQASQSVYDESLSRMEKARLVLGRNRIKPQTNSTLNPTAEEFNSRPLSDISHFSRLKPNPPNSAGTGIPNS